MRKRDYERAMRRKLKKFAEEAFAPMRALVMPIYKPLRRKYGAKIARQMLNDLFPIVYAPPMRVGTHIE